MALSERERQVLDLERDWWVTAPSKQAAIAERIGCSSGAYYAALRRLATEPEAFAYDPLVVQRLRKRAERQRRARAIGGAQVEHRPR